MTTYQGYAMTPQAVQQAKEANDGGRIEESGSYIAKVIRAEFVTSAAPKLTQGIEFEIETVNKMNCTFTVWTRKSDGTELMGAAKLYALMACAHVRNLTPTKQTVEKYDYDAKARINKDAVVAVELMGKTLGWLLEREPYRSQATGDIKNRMALFANFNAENKLVSSEILDRKTKPEELEKLLERLMAKAPKKIQQSNQTPGNYAPDHPYGDAPPILPPDDDLPF